MRKRNILRYLGIALLVVFGILAFLSITGTVAHAAGLVDDTVDAANEYSKYPLENYQLDFYVDSSWDWLPWNWLDGIGKSIQYGLYAITNFVWTVSMYISNATGYVVQEAYKLDFISDTADAIGKNIQTLAGVTENGFSTQGFYVGFLLILILVVGIYVAVKRALMQLEQVEQEILLLRYVNEVPVSDICNILHISRFALYRKTKKAVEHFKNILGEGFI